MDAAFTAKYAGRPFSPVKSPVTIRNRELEEPSSSSPKSFVSNPFASTQPTNPDYTSSVSASQLKKDVEHVYVAVMGVTGSGKSTFVKQCSKVEVEIGHNLQSCTAQVEDFSFEYNARTIVHIIDTPGFDDTNKSDTEVLRDIANWMGSKYQQGILLSGIIFLHRISDSRMNGSAMRNLQMFKKLCGTQCYHSLLLVTTFWDMISEKQAEQIEAQLKQDPRYWGDMLSQGSRYARHLGGEEAATAILDEMIQHRQPFIAALQTEMVKEKKTLAETSAGQQLNADLVALETKHKKDLKRSEENYRMASEDNNERLQLRFEQQVLAMQKQIQEDRAAAKQMQLRLDRLQAEKEEETKKYKMEMEKQLQDIKVMKEDVKRAGGGREKDHERKRLEKQVRSLQNSLESKQRNQPRNDGQFEDFLMGALKTVGKVMIGLPF